jgi:hypothetical protein
MIFYLNNISGRDSSIRSREPNRVAVELFHGLEVGRTDADDDDRQGKRRRVDDGLKKRHLALKDGYLLWEKTESSMAFKTQL